MGLLKHLLAGFIAAAAVAAQIDSFANVTVYDATPNTPSYARTENLPNNTVLAAWQVPNTLNTLSVYRSADSGFSWYTFGTVTSDTTGRVLTQPHLLYLPAAFGDYDAGAVMLAVNAQDTLSTNIEIYVSQDLGESWEFVSRPATGGPVLAANGNAVSEPFLLYHDNMVSLYYTDERDATATSKISHQTTQDDLDSWGLAINDEIDLTNKIRPAKPSVAKLANNRYILAYEYGQGNGTLDAQRPVAYKIAASPENFGTAAAQQMTVDTGAKPGGSPFVTYSTLGGTSGTVVISDSVHNSVFINRAFGAGNWTEMKTTAGRSYAREVRIPNNDANKLRFAGGAEEGQAGESQVLVTVFDFQKALSTLS